MLRRRFRWLLVTAVVVAALTFSVIRQVEPQFRASASLSIDEPVSEAVLDNTALARFARERVAVRHTDVLKRFDVDEFLSGYAAFTGTPETVTSTARAAVLRDRMTASVSDVSQIGGPVDASGVVSVTFSVSVEDPDPSVAEATLEAVLALYAAPRTDAETTALTQELATAAATVEQRSLAIRQLERALDEFRQENAADLKETPAAGAVAGSLAESELAQMESQVLRLQERRVTVDSALRELDPNGILDREVSAPGPATSERLAATQTILSILRGRHGAGHPDVQRLDAEMTAVKAELEREMDLAIQELRTAQTEYERMQQLHSLDYPDVVRLANSVSRLEGVAEELNAIGLSSVEVRRIEDLAREERVVQAQLVELQSARDAARMQVTDLRNRATRAPLLAEQYQALQDDLSTAKTSLAAAVEDRGILGDEYATLVQRNAPPLQLSAPPYVPRAVVITRRSTIVAIGVLFGLLAMGLVITAVERVDRRVLGVRSIVAVHGKPPLAEIPNILRPALARARAS